MESNEDFVVVDDKDAMTEKKDTLDRLHALIDLFSSSLDSVNQSNVLLKEAVETALNVTVHQLTPDYSASIEELINQLEIKVTSTEEVRRNYVKCLCSRLVALHEGNQRLENEYAVYKESTEAKDRENQVLVADAFGALRTMRTSLNSLEGSFGIQPTEMPDPALEETHIFEELTLAELNRQLKDIECRLSIIDLAKSSEFTAPALDANIKLVTESGIQTASRNAEAFSQTAPIQPSLPDSNDTEPSVQQINPTPLPEIPGHATAPLTPTEPYTADEEVPWCPGCGQAFSSRLSLEDHLPSCVE